MRIMCLAVVALVIVIAVFPDDSEGFQALEYDDSHVFQVGEHNVRIQTRSFSFGSGDNGKAELIVPIAERDWNRISIMTCTVTFDQPMCPGRILITIIKRIC